MIARLHVCVEDHCAVGFYSEVCRRAGGSVEFKRRNWRSRRKWCDRDELRIWGRFRGGRRSARSRNFGGFGGCGGKLDLKGKGS